MEVYGADGADSEQIVKSIRGGQGGWNLSKRLELFGDDGILEVEEFIRGGGMHQRWTEVDRGGQS
jgi:hypothetical protein